MKRIFTVLFLLFATLLNAQEKLPLVQIDLGLGGTYFKVPNTLRVLNTPAEAFATVFKADANVYVSRPFSIGVSLVNHKFATNDADSNTNFINAKSGSIVFIANYHVIDKPKFNLSIGSGFGGNRFNYERQEQIDSVTTATGVVKMKGNVFLINLQARYYFMKNLGVFFRPQFHVQGDKIESFTVNGQEQSRILDVPIDIVTFSFRGLSAQLGLSIRF